MITLFDPPPVAELAIRALLCLPFLSSAVEKISDRPAAVAEVRALGLPGPHLVAATVVALQLMAPAMILSGLLAWAGAAALAIFTAVATVMAHGWWRLSGDRRAEARRAFMEHGAIIGGLLLVAYLDLLGR